jgi:hypothetical protein
MMNLECRMTEVMTNDENRDIIPSEVEAATQARMLSGRGQAFNLVVIAFSAARRDPSTPLRFAQDD